MRRCGPSDSEVLQNAAAERGWGERGFSLYERTTIRPSLALNGIVGGYQGEGGKAVIPAHATGKLNFRLVPDQDPHEIEGLFREHISRITPRGVRSQVRGTSYAKPALVPRDHPAIRAAAVAYRLGFGAEPVFLRVGGSLPVVNSFQEILGIPTVLMGFALPDDRLHGPNEKFHLPVFYKAIRTSIAFLHELARHESPSVAASNRTTAFALAGADI
jgi:acetylornithine deacetylase/succinyl-diaminopimelate desuccinylase-like protein